MLCIQSTNWTPSAVVKSLADVRRLVDQESHQCAERQAKAEQLVSQQLLESDFQSYV